jgi:hypothetical protein
MASSSTQIRGVAGGQGRTSPTKWEAWCRMRRLLGRYRTGPGRRRQRCGALSWAATVVRDLHEGGGGEVILIRRLRNRSSTGMVRSNAELWGKSR